MLESVENTERFLRMSGLFGRRQVFLVGRGATALMLLYEALGEPGGRIVLPAIACPSLLATVLLTGRKPVVVDVDRNLNIDPKRVREVVQPGDIVLGVHIYGIPCAIEELEQICREKNAVLIEDAAQAVGGRLEGEGSVRGRPIGTFGIAGILSFAGGKILPTTGGGAILTEDVGLIERLKTAIAGLPERPSDLAEKSQSLRDTLTDAFNEARRNSFGAGSSAAAIWETVYGDYPEIYRYKVGPFEAGEIADSIRRLGMVAQNRLIGARYYRAYLDGPGIEFPDYPDGCCPFRFTFIMPENSGAEVQDCTDAIRAAEINASNLYLPLHWLAPSMVEAGECPRAEFASTRLINLWVHDDFPQLEASRAAEIVRKYKVSGHNS